MLFLHAQSPNVKNKLGFMLLSFPRISFHLTNFLEITGPQHSAEFIEKSPSTAKVIPPQALAKWKIQGQHKQTHEFFPFGESVVSHPSGEKYEVVLYRYLETLTYEFLLSELEMPAEVRGAICIIDAAPESMKDGSPENYKKRVERERNDLEWSPIAWIRWNNLPFTIVLLKEADATPMISADDIREIYDLTEDVPIIDCPSGLNQESVDNILRQTLNYILPKISKH